MRDVRSRGVAGDERRRLTVPQHTIAVQAGRQAGKRQAERQAGRQEGRGWAGGRGWQEGRRGQLRWQQPRPLIVDYWLVGVRGIAEPRLGRSQLDSGRSRPSRCMTYMHRNGISSIRVDLGCDSMAPGCKKLALPGERSQPRSHIASPPSAAIHLFTSPVDALSHAIHLYNL